MKTLNHQLNQINPSLHPNTKPALLALANGEVFYGQSIGADGERVGEIVFNTAMTGYQEIVTDPSYTKQIITLTYPHIGNVGTNDADWEAQTIHASGLVVRDNSMIMSSWRGEKILSQFLSDNDVVGISGIDTRYITQLLRRIGAQKACIMAGDNLDTERALELARGFSGLKGMDLAREVTTPAVYEWDKGGEWQRATDYTTATAQTTSDNQPNEQAFHVVVYDFGIKHNILRMLAERGCRLTVVPAQTSPDTVLAMRPDGVFLSNGPGDPAPCDYAIEAARCFIERRIPLFGICLGMQLLALASGADVVKMKFGHHGANHPVEATDTKRVYITSQNHGFAVDEYTLPDCLRITHRSLFDGSLQGIARKDAPAFGFQGHPEASPGPHDIAELFDQFIALMKDA